MSNINTNPNYKYKYEYKYKYKYNILHQIAPPAAFLLFSSKAAVS